MSLFHDPIFCALLYVWFGAWSLAHLVFNGLIAKAKEALVDWMVDWEERGWFPKPTWLALLCLILLWPLAWMGIIWYWK